MTAAEIQSEKHTSFIDLCVEGKALPEEINDYVAEWHASVSNQPIYDFLGMTQQEYRKWVRDPGTLSSIIMARAPHWNDPLNQHRESGFANE